MKRVSRKEYLDFLNENEGKLEFNITDISDPPMSYGWVKGEYNNIVCKAYCYDYNECDYWIDDKFDKELKMIIYRPHRGSFKDAMAEAKVFSDEEEMKEYICAQWEIDGVRMFDEEDIVVKDEALDDSRNGWKDTRYVCVKRIGSDVYEIPQCIGMCATEFQEKIKRPPSE